MGKGWESEWVAMRDYNLLLPLAPETSFLPEFAYKGEETEYKEKFGRHGRAYRGEKYY